jgi:hypothetical protein
MANGWASQEIEKTSIDDLLKLIKGLTPTESEDSGLDVALDIEKIQEKRTKRKVDTVDALIDQIGKIGNLNQLSYSASNIPSLQNLVKGNPEAELKLQSATFDIQNKSNEFLAYKSQMDYMANSRESAPIIREDPVTQTSESVPGGWANHTDIDISKYTIDYVQNELRDIENFRSTLYKDPVRLEGNRWSKKDPNKFIGSYNPEGGLTDVALINDVEKRERVLLAAAAAMEENGIIDKHEMFWVVTGDKAGLDERRKERLEDITANIKSNLSSMNAIRGYRKQLLNAIGKGDLTGGDPFADIDIGDMGSLLQAFGIDKNNPYYKDMDDETYLQEKINQYKDMDINDVISSWDDELMAYQMQLDFELDRYLKWAGVEYMADTDKRKREERRELIKILQQQ